jgi:outer membrane protein assembly factor BamB
MKRIRRLALVVGSAGMLVGASSCSAHADGDGDATSAIPLEHGSPWPKFRGGAAQDGVSRVVPSARGGAMWSFRTGKGVFSSPVVAADGTIYVGSADRTLYALSPDGTVRWKEQTGDIIDSAALLDDRGRVYFGSGDGKLRARVAATGAEVWTMQADDPSVSKAFINWFEGNVAMGPSGRLYVPNDDFFVYAVDRDTGAVTRRYKMPDQTWSSPAVDANDGTLFIGNNNLLPILGKNTFAIAADGTTSWSSVTPGSVAASPMLTQDGHVVVGGFDGYVRAYDRSTGAMLWQSATRDHVYASAALLPDGAVLQPSTDGTVYALDGATGAVRWTFDVGEPIRSSPAVDGEGNVYFGAGDGRLYVLRADGTLRFSILLVDDARNDLNSSPALGRDAIYLGAESGEVFSVPYDFCLRPEAASDTRCRTIPEATDSTRCAPHRPTAHSPA